MDDLLWLEREVQAVYDRTLQPLAKRLAIELPVSGKDAAGLPILLPPGIIDRANRRLSITLSERRSRRPV